VPDKQHSDLQMLSNTLISLLKVHRTSLC